MTNTTDVAVEVAGNEELTPFYVEASWHSDPSEVVMMLEEYEEHYWINRFFRYRRNRELKKSIGDIFHD